MPELPEVETVRLRVMPDLLGSFIQDFIHVSPSLRYPIQEDFIHALSGQSFESLTRHGKYIMAKLENGAIFLVHLGMSGMFEVIKDPDHIKRKHDHLIARLNTGALLVFHDPRRFGDLRVFVNSDAANYKHYMRNLGMDALHPDLSASYLHKKAKTSRVPIKNFLLDQRVVAGLGNIYVCEALYDSGISPLRKACDVTDKEWHKLHIAILDVLNRALISGGSTLRDFRDQGGNGGYFQHEFNAYDREGQPCRHCQQDGIVIIRIVQSGRSSFYCPHHQSSSS